MQSPFTAINEDLMRQDRKAARMGIVVALIAVAILVLAVLALRYGLDLHQALNALMITTGAE